MTNLATLLGYVVVELDIEGEPVDITTDICVTPKLALDAVGDVPYPKGHRGVVAELHEVEEPEP